MVQRGLHLDLVQEAVCQTGIAFKIGQQNLHGLDAVRKSIANLINLTHATGAQYLDDFVVANRDRRCSCCLHSGMRCPHSSAASASRVIRGDYGAK